MKFRNLGLLVILAIISGSPIQAQFSGLKVKLLRVGASQGAKAIGVDNYLSNLLQLPPASKT